EWGKKVREVGGLGLAVWEWILGKLCLFDDPAETRQSERLSRLHNLLYGQFDIKKRLLSLQEKVTFLSDLRGCSIRSRPPTFGETSYNGIDPSTSPGPTAGPSDEPRCSSPWPHSTWSAARSPCCAADTAPATRRFAPPPSASAAR